MLGVSVTTCCLWKKRYAGMGVAEPRRVKQVEDENRPLKQVVADLTLDKQISSVRYGAHSRQHVHHHTGAAYDQKLHEPGHVAYLNS